jgi:hypothetical protein
MYLDEVQRRVRVSLDEFAPLFVLRILYVEVDPGGTVVEIANSRSGILGLFDDAILVVRNFRIARTIFEEVSLKGLRAEAVSVSINGARSAAFRVLGQENGLYVLDPHIGGGTAKQDAMRDRIVSRINGEIQAGPTAPETVGPFWNAIPRLISRRDQFNDPRSPALDEKGQIVLGDGERVLFSGRRAIVVYRNVQTGYVLRGGPWKPMTTCTNPAELWITDRRVVFQWRDWNLDSSSSVMIERRQRGGFSDEAPGELSVAGQLTWAWISSIFVNENASDPGPTSLEFQARDNGVLLRLGILGVSGEESHRISREAAAAVAMYRLSTDDTVTNEERSVLETASQGQPTVNELEWGEQIILPSSFKIGQDTQSLN